MIWNVRISYRMKNISSVLFPFDLYLQNRGGPFNIMWRRNGIPLKDNLSWISQNFELNSYLSLEWLLIVLSCASLRERNSSDYSRGRWSKVTFLRRGKSENLAKRNELGSKYWRREWVKKTWPKPQIAEVMTKEGDGEEEWECFWWGGLPSVLWKDLLLGL